MGQAAGGSSFGVGHPPSPKRRRTNTHLMRIAGRLFRRFMGMAKTNGNPVVHCPAGDFNHEFAVKYLLNTNIRRDACFWFWWGRVQAPVRNLSAKHRTVNIFQK
jgi:hypothetical protein